MELMSGESRVEKREIDLSATIQLPVGHNSVTGLVINAWKGPANRVVTVLGDSVPFEQTFGKSRKLSKEERSNPDFDTNPTDQEKLNSDLRGSALIQDITLHNKYVRAIGNRGFYSVASWPSQGVSLELDELEKSIIGEIQVRIPKFFSGGSGSSSSGETPEEVPFDNTLWEFFFVIKCDSGKIHESQLNEIKNEKDFAGMKEISRFLTLNDPRDRNSGIVVKSQAGFLQYLINLAKLPANGAFKKPQPKKIKDPLNPSDPMIDNPDYDPAESGAGKRTAIAVLYNKLKNVVGHLNDELDMTSMLPEEDDYLDPSKEANIKFPFPALNTLEAITLAPKGFTLKNTNGEIGLADVEEANQSQVGTDLRFCATDPSALNNAICIKVVPAPLGYLVYEKEDEDGNKFLVAAYKLNKAKPDSEGYADAELGEDGQIQYLFINGTSGRFIETRFTSETNLPTNRYGFDWINKYDEFPFVKNSDGKWILNDKALWYQFYKILVTDIGINTNADVLKAKISPDYFKLVPDYNAWRVLENDDPKKTALKINVSIDIDNYDRNFQIFESFIVAPEDVVDENGVNYNVLEVVNGNSAYIYVPRRTADPSKFPKVVSRWQILTAGRDPRPANYAQMEAGMRLFNSVEANKINMICAAPFEYDLRNNPGATSFMLAARECAITRDDCNTVFQGSGIRDRNNEQILESAMTNISSSSPTHAANIATWGRYFDKNIGQTVLLPSAYAFCAESARNDINRTIWTPPAGLNYGILPYYQGVHPMLSKKEYGLLQDNNINGVLFYPKYGFAFHSQRTTQIKKTALSQWSVRRMVTWISDSLAIALETFLQEPVNGNTRARIQSTCESFLNGVYTGGGLAKPAVVVCDKSNNPDIVEENAQINCHLMITPALRVEYIKLTTVVLKVSMDAGALNIEELL